MVKVSVIVPIYNVETYLEECLEHIRMQTLTDIEVIMINDGSTDNSVEIAEKYVRMDSRFQLVSQNNLGLSVARNVGAQMAKGKYLHFCDSDDYLAEQALELLYHTAEEKDADIVQMASVKFYDGDIIQNNVGEKADLSSNKLRDCYEKLKPGKELMDELLKNKVSPQAQRLFINREYLESSDVCFYPGILHEDNLFFFQIYWNAGRVYWLPEKIYYHRERQGSIMHTEHRKESCEGYAHTFLEMWKQCKENPEVIEKYPNILNYVKFSLAQVVENYKRMGLDERKQIRLLMKIVKSFINEIPIKKSKSTYLFLYAPFLLK